jgi:hypothetical protein
MGRLKMQVTLNINDLVYTIGFYLDDILQKREILSAA